MYNKFGVGQLNEAVLPNGRKVFRANTVKMKVGENIQDVECVYDPDHFVYQYKLPITQEEYETLRTTTGHIPLDRLGTNAMCTCGAEAVIIMDARAPMNINGKVMCGFMAQFGKHQTSLIIKDGIGYLPKEIEQDHVMLDSDLDKLYKKVD